MRGTAAFVGAVLGSVTWRAVLLTQSLGLAIALLRWPQAQYPTVAWLLMTVVSQALAALLVMLATLAGDQAIRRGWPVWRAVVTGLFCVSAVVALATWGLRAPFGFVDPGPHGGVLYALGKFLDVCAYWGMAMMVFLNGRSAARMLAGVRTTELERVQVERRLLASRLAAAEAHIDPGVVLKQLAEIRDSFAAARPAADEQLEKLIADLRRSVTPDGIGAGL
jgi:hypothetical protein